MSPWAFQPPAWWPALLVILPKWALKARHQDGARAEYFHYLRRAVADGLRGRRGHRAGPMAGE